MSSVGRGQGTTGVLPVGFLGEKLLLCWDWPEHFDKGGELHVLAHKIPLFGCVDRGAGHGGFAWVLMPCRTTTQGTPDPRGDQRNNPGNGPEQAMLP